MPILRRGSRGDEVTRLQLLLNASLAPSPGLLADGDFGRRTHDAVVRFQEARGLLADGVVGPATWGALAQLPGPCPPHPVTSPDAPWLAVARAEMGVRELSTRDRHNERIVEYHQTTTFRAQDDETPWCASFVNWVMIQAGYRGRNSARARDWLDWGRDLGDQPRSGAVAVIKRRSGGGHDQSTGSSSGWHVAFYLAGDGQRITLLGGNQSNRVKESSYPLASYDVRGYRWPTARA